MKAKRNIENDVIFRVWKPDNAPAEVIALWPAVEADPHGVYCQSFLHIGQHGPAGYYEVIDHSRPAKPEEFADLLAELRQRGYEPHVIQRASRRHHDHRREVDRA